ncbi:MAG TPA: hypothetical protein VFH45_13190 [Acidimicrobiales bacterium]|nr:hypothetical protein [Acidimicrobiales bacterium]
MTGDVRSNLGRRPAWAAAAVVLVALALAACGGGGSRVAGRTGSGGGRSAASTTTTSSPTSTTSTSPTTTALPTTSTTSSAAPSGDPLGCAGAADFWTMADGTPVNLRATLGPVRATVTGTKTTRGGPTLAGARLRLTSGGRVLIDQAIPPPRTDPPSDIGVMPQSIGPAQPVTPTADTTAASPLCLASFKGMATPTVVMGLTTGGAHCCTVVRAVPARAGGTASTVDRDLGNPGAELRAEGGHAVVVTADNAFAYEFTDYAGSGMPVRVLELGPTGFVDTTRGHLSMVASDADQWWSAFGEASAQHDGNGVLAAWVADECVLGRSSQAWATVDRLQAQGRLVGPSGWPSGSAFVRNLRGFLTAQHYC